MASPGHPSIGLGYLFYVLLRTISYISGENRTRKRKYGKLILPAVLSFMISIMIILIILILYI